jgi:type VI secretion system protein ImpA
VLDIDRLLEPITEDRPVGDDPRENYDPDSLYRMIRDARTKAREAERTVVYDEAEAGPPPDWQPIVELGSRALSEQAKDLEVAAYLIEGLVRVHGYAGLRDGFRLARGLIERYWENVYPVPDEDGVRTRVDPLARLNGEDAEGLLVGPLSKVPITDNGSVGPFNPTQYRAAKATEAMDAEARGQRLAQPGMISLQTFEQAVRETSVEFVENLLDDLAQASEEFTALWSALESHCTDAEPGYPPSSDLKRALAECEETIRVVYRDRLPQEGEAAEEGVEEGEAAAAAGGGRGVPGTITSREEAFKTLDLVAQFFRRTEPHSPLAYLLEQAVRWGRLSLPDLLNELIPDRSTREQLFKLVGIQLPDEEG